MAPVAPLGYDGQQAMFYDGAERPVREVATRALADLMSYVEYVPRDFAEDADPYASLLDGLQVAGTGEAAPHPLTWAVTLRVVGPGRLQLETRSAGLGFQVDDVWAAVCASRLAQDAERTGDVIELRVRRGDPERENAVRDALEKSCAKRTRALGDVAAALLKPVLESGELARVEQRELEDQARSLVEAAQRRLEAVLSERRASLFDD